MPTNLDNVLIFNAPQWDGNKNTLPILGELRCGICFMPTGLYATRENVAHRDFATTCHSCWERLERAAQKEEG